MSEPAPHTPAESTEPGWPGLIAFARLHPWITAIMLVSTLGGAGMGPLVFEETWSLTRQIAAGGFLGAWIGLTITVTKMIG